jgi:quercetin dioxygenase-like cupin family protein
MKRSSIAAAVAAVMLAATTLGLAQAEKKAAPAKKAVAKKTVYASPDQAKFVDSPNSPGVSSAILRGDPDQGPHATYTKFKPGYDSGWHTHTADVWIIGIKGAYLYKDDAGEKRVGPGDYLRVPGGHKHWSGGDKTEGALFFEEAAGKFDLIPTK